MEKNEVEIGRVVVYSPLFGKTETGVITDFNGKFAFVRYEGETVSKATHPKDLKYVEGETK